MESQPIVKDKVKDIVKDIMGIGWLGLRLVLKSPLWLAPVVYLAPLKPIIIIIIIIITLKRWTGAGLDEHIMFLIGGFSYWRIGERDDPTTDYY